MEVVHKNATDYLVAIVGVTYPKEIKDKINASVTRKEGLSGALVTVAINVVTEVLTISTKRGINSNSLMDGKDRI